MRKATFIKTDEGKYRPVNKRAKEFTYKKPQVSKFIVRLIAKKHNVKCYVWTDAGLRKVA